MTLQTKDSNKTKRVHLSHYSFKDIDILNYIALSMSEFFKPFSKDLKDKHFVLNRDWTFNMTILDFHTDKGLLRNLRMMSHNSPRKPKTKKVLSQRDLKYGFA